MSTVSPESLENIMLQKELLGVCLTRLANPWECGKLIHDKHPHHVKMLIKIDTHEGYHTFV